MHSPRSKLITCFLATGRALDLIERLRKVHGVSSASYHHARGVGTGSRRGTRAFFSTEREVITVLVPEDQADEIFRFMFYEAGLDAPNTGMIFIERALRASPCVLPQDAPTGD